MNSLEIERFLSNVCHLKILVVGDLMLDEYVWGQTQRISPEAPVPVVDVRDNDLRLGGAGNVVVNLLALGCSVDVISVIGDDEDGRTLRRIFQDMEIDTAGVLIDKARMTTRKTRILANNQQMLRIDKESRFSLVGDVEQHLIERIGSLSHSYHAILISDYLKGVLTESVLQSLCDLGHRMRIPVIIDPKGNDYKKYSGATLLTPNLKEVELATGLDVSDKAALLDAGTRLLKEVELESLIVTRSEKGMSIFESDRVEHIPTSAKEVFDVTGAGDSVLALLGLGLAGGLNLVDAAWLSNVGAGIVVGKIGTSTVSPEEILATIKQWNTENDSKILPLPELLEALKPLKADGGTIVFTNGCFDLLHAGHVKYLQKARQLGDALVLGLNSDSSIRRLKGEKRPLLEESERAHILAALDCIDYLILFDDDTPIDLIRASQPDILAKGADYEVHEVVGRDVVEGYGGRVELVQFVEGRSTTNIINEILSRYRDEP